MKKHIFYIISLFAFAAPSSLLADTLRISNQSDGALFADVVNPRNQQVIQNNMVEPGATVVAHYQPNQAIKFFAYNQQNQQVPATLYPGQLQGHSQLTFSTPQRKLNNQHTLQPFLNLDGGKSPQHGGNQVTFTANTPHTVGVSYNNNGQSQIETIQNNAGGKTLNIPANTPIQVNMKLNKVGQPNIPQQEPGICKIPTSLLHGNDHVHIQYQKSQRSQINGNNICPFVMVNGQAVQQAPAHGGNQPAPAAGNSVKNRTVHITNSSKQVGQISIKGSNDKQQLQPNQSIDFNYNNNDTLQIYLQAADGSRPLTTTVPGNLLTNHDHLRIKYYHSQSDISDLDSAILTNDGSVLSFLKAYNGQNTIKVSFENKSPHTGYLQVPSGPSASFLPGEKLHLVLPQNNKPSFIKAKMRSHLKNTPHENQETTQISTNNLSNNSNIVLQFKESQHQNLIQNGLENFITINGQPLSPGHQPPAGPARGSNNPPAGPAKGSNKPPAGPAGANDGSFSIQFHNQSPHTGWIIDANGNRTNFNPNQSLTLHNIRPGQGFTVYMKSNVAGVVSTHISQAYKGLHATLNYQKTQQDQNILRTNGLSKFMHYHYA